MNLNKIILVGRVTRDPELKALPTGTAITTFSLATNRVWNKDGQKQEEVEFHNIVTFGNMAENIGKYVKKGQLLLVEGRNATRSWDDKETGKKMYKTDIIAESFQFGPKSEGTQNTQKTEDEEEIDYPEDEINPEDIPF